ncbi:MAG: 2-oxoisovalerate dehydrogenase E1 component [Flavobacteriales bacterium]|jgi:2-oxoisovalerate dehydrogenase E1 component
MSESITEVVELSDQELREQMLSDFRIACISRETSLLGRKEVLTGKAKFGIFGDGKEVAQLAMARCFKKGDFRSGYYRDQTLMFALDLITVKEYFAALYGHTDVEKEPASGGRQMGGHYATRNLNADGSWKNLMEQYNSSADVSPTASQMPRLLGLAQASKIYRESPDLAHFTNFSNKGNEVAFGTIGDASTSEGLFWETMNAACVLGVPMVMSVWDDGYGISVPKKFQTVKESISEALSGFAIGKEGNGMKIYKTKGWDYPHLIATYEKATAYARKNHIPVLVHVEEMTQPQGHSTSGSHERYKTPERLAWAKEYDCVDQLQQFIQLQGPVEESEFDAIRNQAKKDVRAQQKEAWVEFRADIDAEKVEALTFMDAYAQNSDFEDEIGPLIEALRGNSESIRRDIVSSIRQILLLSRGDSTNERDQLVSWLEASQKVNYNRYSDKLYSESAKSVQNIDAVDPVYDPEAELVDGRIILRENFAKIFEKYPEVLTFGEDTGTIGGVNQSMEGMQEQFGKLRVADTGIREATIIGQGIGMSMRGLRPIAEIQYLDYLYYALQLMRDDLATVQYRTRGGQKAPLIIRTRGHRLEGIWHSGSPMSAIVNSIRGIHVCVPRNMAIASGMYNTLLEGDEPALVVECLNGYRKKEQLPTNLGEHRIRLGKVEIVEEGSDITLVSYGSTFNIAMEARETLTKLGISVEMVDVQTLLPFDELHEIAASVKKTNRLFIVDEDVPGGTTAYILDQVLNKQGAYYSLDSEPKTMSSKPHLPAYGTDGDYFSKPSADDIVEAVYEMMSESDPNKFLPIL